MQIFVKNLWIKDIDIKWTQNGGEKVEKYNWLTQSLNPNMYYLPGKNLTTAAQQEQGGSVMSMRADDGMILCLYAQIC